MNDDFDDLRLMLFESLPDRLAILEAGCKAIAQRKGLSLDVMGESLEASRLCLHNLAGLGGSIGLQELTDLARPIEEQIVGLATVKNEENYSSALEQIRLSIIELIAKSKALAS